MQRSILAVSPDLSFLEQIRSHLEEGGRYRVSGYSTGQEALAAAENLPFDAALLDADITDVLFVPFTRDLVAIQPELKLLVYPMQNNPHHPALTGLVVNGFLNKPFFTPEVGTALTNLFRENLPDPVTVVEKPDDLADLWLEKPEMGAHRIEQLLSATTASVGLLVMHGQVIAGSGPVDDLLVTNVINFLDRYTRNYERSEIVRYLKMEGDPNEHLVFAAPLIRNVMLVLLYPPSVSIQQIRKEVALVKHEFQQAYPTTGELRKDLAGFVPPSQDTSPIPAQPLISEPFLSYEMPSSKEEIESTDEIEDSSEPSEVLSEADLQNLDKLLAEMPSPDPEISGEDIYIPPLPVEDLVPPQWVTDQVETTPEFDQQPEIQEPIEQKVEDSEEKIIEELPGSDNPEVSAIPELPDFDFELPWEETSVEPIQSSPPPLPWAESGTIETLPPEVTETGTVEILPPQVTESATDNIIPRKLSTEYIKVEDNDPGTTPLGIKSVRFHYTCILVPRNTNQFLARDLSERLGFILPQLHLGYGWRMTSISIRPLYLLWSVIVPYNVSPFQLVREIRRRTTTHIFTNFPTLMKGNESNDFWAPGFLAISGTEPPSINLIYDFIQQTRKNQQSQN